MGKKKRQQEIERDRQILAEALRELTAGVSLPESLTAGALFARMQADAAKAGEKPRRAARLLDRRREARERPGYRPLSQRIGGWMRPFAAVAAVFLVCAGTLLAYQRRGASFSGAAMNQSAPSPMAAAGAGDVAYDLADATDTSSSASVTQAPGAQAEAAEDAPAEGAPQAQASIPAGEEDGAAVGSDSMAPVLGDAGPQEEKLLAKSLPTDVAQPTAAFGGGISQLEVSGGVEGGSSWQDGQYLYYLAAPVGEQGTSLCILQIQDMQLTASISVQEDAQAVMVFGDRMALISSETEDSGEEQTAILRADIYDVADRSAPTLERTIRQDGTLAKSALQEDRLCLVSICMADGGEQAASSPAPHVRDSLAQGDGTLTGEQLLVPEETTDSSWTVLTFLSLGGAGAAPASLAIFGGTDSLLLDRDRGYLAASRYGETVQSQVFSLSLERGIPRQTAYATLPGGLLLPQALTPLPDGVLAAVQQEGAQRFYRMDAALSQPTEVLLFGVPAGNGDTQQAEALQEPENTEQQPAFADTASQDVVSGDTASGEQEQTPSLHTETPQYSAAG